jgi:hypothetical protein
LVVAYYQKLLENGTARFEKRFEKSKQLLE